MPEEIKATTAIETPGTTGYVVAQGVMTGQHADTSSIPQQGRTVVTSMTTGQVSLRYAPRRAKPAGGTDTVS